MRIIYGIVHLVYRKLTYTLLGLTLVSTLSLPFISKVSAKVSDFSRKGTGIKNGFTCQTSNFQAYKPTEGKKSYATPEKIVIEPWRGEHNVYAIFTIPGGHYNDRRFTVTVDGVGTYCGTLQFAGTEVADGVPAKPGYYLMRGHLRTRATLWLMMQGKGDELYKATNWKVGYAKAKE
ncbi:MAG: hypothetical protein VKL59_01635 [Nostocaceae cyanobacterium]|nr:hypothetical protein [Nostocaceae cyanobacterium]